MKDNFESNLYIVKFRENTPLDELPDIYNKTQNTIVFWNHLKRNGIMYNIINKNVSLYKDELFYIGKIYNGIRAKRKRVLKKK